ncbi:MAG: prephenate dehydratase domain-containing protein [Nanoarchaeota archaeon]
MLGPKGTFSEEAGHVHLKRRKIKGRIKYYPTIKDCFTALNKYEVEEIIVPLINSTIGYILETLNNLNTHKILDEINIPINLYLVGNETKKIYTKKEAAEQCRLRLSKLESKIIYEDSTASAAINARTNNQSAIVSERCADMYNLNILERNIQDNKNNYTKFIVLVL